MRRLLLLLLVPLLAACGGGTGVGATPVGGGGRHAVGVASRQLTAYKRQTQVPDCPKVGRAGVGGGMPAVTLPCLGGGRAVDVAGLRGPMVVNLWASWCGECRQEMPALAAYARSQSRVRVLGIDFLDSQPGAALQLAKASKVAYPLLADPQGSLDRASPLPHIPGLPVTVFLDARGRVAHVEAGAMLTRRAVASAVSTYLGVHG